MRDLAEWILKRDDFAIVPHVSPDGDSYGSSLALALGLKSIGKRALVVVPPVPAMYSFLPGQELICQKEDMPFVPKALVHLDTAAYNRIAATFEKNIPAALIDHHETNTGFDDIRWIDGSASSTGEMLMLLLQEMQIDITADMGVCLYTAMSTDTCNFQFSNTTPTCLRCTAQLLEGGLDIGRISAKLFRSRTLARTQLLGEALHAMRLSHGGRVAMTIVSKEMMARCNATHADTESIVNYLNEIQGVKAAAMLEERDGETKVSLRSPEQIDVAQIASAFGGGGHRYAAGATIAADPEMAAGLLEERLGEAVE